MLAVLGSVTLDHLPLAVVSLQGETHGQDVVAWFDDLKDSPDSVPLLLGRLSGLQVFHEFVLDDSSPAVEEALHHAEEVRVVAFFARGLAVAPQPHEGRRGRQSGIAESRGQSAASRSGKELSQVPVHV